MAEHTTASALEEFFSQYDLSLKPHNWRLCASFNPNDIDSIGDVTFRCTKIRSYSIFDSPIAVGTCGEFLDGLEISLEIRSASPEFFQKNTAAESGHKEIGFIQYYPPIKTDDGVVNDVHGSIAGRCVVPRQIFQHIWSVLSSSSPDQIVINVTMKFPDSLHNWQHDKAMPIIDASVVFLYNQADDIDEQKSKNEHENPVTERLDLILNKVGMLVDYLPPRIPTIALITILAVLLIERLLR